MRRYVAGRAGIGVLPPDPADVVAALQHHEFGHVVPDGESRGHTPEPGSDHGDPWSLDIIRDTTSTVTRTE